MNGSGLFSQNLNNPTNNGYPTRLPYSFSGLPRSSWGLGAAQRPLHSSCSWPPKLQVVASWGRCVDPGVLAWGSLAIREGRGQSTRRRKSAASGAELETLDGSPARRGRAGPCWQLDQAGGRGAQTGKQGSPDLVSPRWGGGQQSAHLPRSSGAGGPPRAVRFPRSARLGPRAEREGAR